MQQKNRLRGEGNKIRRIEVVEDLEEEASLVELILETNLQIQTHKKAVGRLVAQDNSEEVLEEGATIEADSGIKKGVLLFSQENAITLIK